MQEEVPEQIVDSETGLQRALSYVNHVYADRTETHLEMDDRHTNRHGSLHGGIYSMILDSACGFAASRSFSDDASQLVFTVSLTVNYLAAARAGHVRAIGRVSRAGRSVVFCNGEVFDSTDTLVATGTAVFKRAAAKK